MTLDDLMTLFQSARQGTRDWNGTEWVGVYGGDRAGVTAIVRALRDELSDKCTAYAWSGDDLESAFNQILGSDAGEKVAEGNFTNPSEGRVIAPATNPIPDAAPAVCVWTPRSNEPGFYATPHGIKFKDRRYDNCGICGGEIKFTEAK